MGVSTKALWKSAMQAAFLTNPGCVTAGCQDTKHTLNVRATMVSRYKTHFDRACNHGVKIQNTLYVRATMVSQNAPNTRLSLRNLGYATLLAGNAAKAHGICNLLLAGSAVKAHGICNLLLAGSAVKAALQAFQSVHAHSSLLLGACWHHNYLAQHVQTLHGACKVYGNISSIARG